jgi:ribosomal-protein-alanine N-acetyltransferase
MKNIRMMTTLDLDQVIAIELVCSVDPWPRSIFLSCLDKYQPYVLTLDRKVIGFAVLMYADIECQLLNIAISPEYQHHGYGRYLLADLIDSARAERAKELLLEVRVSNLPAQALYKKFGFSIIDERKDYYLTPTGREDAYVMLLKL